MPNRHNNDGMGSGDNKVQGLRSSRKHGPDLTSDIRAELLNEIANFDENETLAAIEDNAVGGSDNNAYWDFVDSELHGIEPLAANPDRLTEDEAVSFDRPDIGLDVEDAKKIIDEILSYRELQVWRLIMRKGVSYKNTANLLRISESAVSNYLQRAKDKVKRYLGE